MVDWTDFRQSNPWSFNKTKFVSDASGVCELEQCSSTTNEYFVLYMANLWMVTVSNSKFKLFLTIFEGS